MKRGLSIPGLVFAVWAPVATLIFGNRLIGGDGDPVRHVALGERILAAGNVLRTDTFSFTRSGEPFLGFEFGSEVLYALAHRAAGLAGVAVLAGLLIGFTYALLARFLIRRGADPALAYLTATAAAVLGAAHWIARPHLVTQLLTVVLLGMVDSERRVPLRWFGVLFLVWANLHGGFVFGLVLIGMFAVGHLLEGVALAARPEAWRRARHLLGAIAVGGVAVCLNPYGIRLPLHVLGFLGDKTIPALTEEFLSPNFHQLGPRLFLLALLVSLAALALDRRRVPWPRRVVYLSSIAFALLAQRNITLFALTGLPLIALHLDPAWRRLPEPPGFRASFARALGGHTLLPVAVVTAVLIALAGVEIGGRRAVPQTLDPRVFPIQAVAEARGAGVQGRIFNRFIWGGYLLYAWPEMKVYIDPGSDHYGGPLLEEYLRVWRLEPGWRDVLERRRIDLALIPPVTPLAAALEREPGWSVWYRDSTAVMFRRGAAPR